MRKLNDKIKGIIPHPSADGLNLILGIDPRVDVPATPARRVKPRSR